MNREKKGESHGEVCFLDPSSFHRHHPDGGVLPVPGGRWLDPERYTREFPGEPALARTVARHRCPDASLSVVLELVHQRAHRHASGPCSAHPVVTGRWGCHLLLPGSDCLSIRERPDGYLPGFSSGRGACGRAGNGQNGCGTRLLCATDPVDAATVRDLHSPCLLCACRLRRGHPFPTPAAPVRWVAPAPLRPR